RWRRRHEQCARSPSGDGRPHCGRAGGLAVAVGRDICPVPGGVRAAPIQVHAAQPRRGGGDAFTVGRSQPRRHDPRALTHLGVWRPEGGGPLFWLGDKTAMLVMAPAAAPVEPCDTHDFAALYRSWFRPVYRWIRATGGPGIDAEDHPQDVFIVVQRRLGCFDGVNLAGWLYRITRLTVHDHQRRAWFRNIFLRPRDIALEDFVSSTAGPDERFDRKRCEQRLSKLVDRLNPRWRDSFLLFEVAGLT